VWLMVDFLEAEVSAILVPDWMWAPRSAHCRRIGSGVTPRVRGQKKPCWRNRELGR
jgi:hypothetical protein